MAQPRPNRQRRNELVARQSGAIQRDMKLEGDVSPIHDPGIIREGDTYPVFASNRFAQKLVPMFCSRDLRPPITAPGSRTSLRS